MGSEWIRISGKVPVLRLLLPYIVGIVCLPNDVRLPWAILSIGLILPVLYRILEHGLTTAWTFRWMPGIAFALSFMALGGFARQRLDQQANCPPVGHAFLAWVEVDDLPVTSARSRSCSVTILATEDCFQAWKGKCIRLYLPKDYSSARLCISDRLKLRLSPRKPEKSTDPFGFDFQAWLHHKGICATAWVPAGTWTNCGPASGWNLRVHSEHLRRCFVKRLARTELGWDEQAFAAALVLGDTRLLDKDVKMDFSTAGISHILSVSGLHVAVIYGLLAFLLGFMERIRVLRVPRQVLLILSLFAYAFVTGMSPSVLRSAFMFSLMAFGKCLGRRSQTLNTVLLSAFILLLMQPGYLYDLGFQLSYLAVVGIVVVHPRLTALWSPPFKPLAWLWEMSCLSVVAQASTAPLTVHAFHTFPLYFMLNNLIAVPFSSLLIFLTTGFLLLGNIPLVGGWLGTLLNACLHLFLTLSDAAGRMPHALLGSLYPDQSFIMVLYLVACLAFMTFLLKRRVAFIPMLAAMAALQLTYLWQCFTTT